MYVSPAGGKVNECRKIHDEVTEVSSRTNCGAPSQDVSNCKSFDVGTGSSLCRFAGDGPPRVALTLVSNIFKGGAESHECLSVTGGECRET
jgi:hypothetical protein